MALEQVHVLDAAEVAVERGGHDDDGDLGAAPAQIGGDFGAELAGAEVVVEDGDVDLVEELGGFFDGGGGNACVAVLAQDGGAEMQIGWFVVEQQGRAQSGRTEHSRASSGSGGSAIVSGLDASGSGRESTDSRAILIGT